MHFERIARELYAKPWAIHPATYQTFHDVFQRKLADVSPQDAKISVMGMEIEYKLPQDYENAEGVAVIKIDGALGHRLSAIDKACMGGVDYGDIQAAIAKAESDPEVMGIVLDINSPGGMVTGLAETAQRIKSAYKPVVAFTDSLAASAGYYLACGASAFFSTASAQVGCIGTLMTWIDITEAMEAQGLKREMIASGKYKGMMFPGLPLTDEQRQLLQDEVDMLAEEFKSFVRDARGDVPEDAMEGQTLFGNPAAEANLTDGVADLAAAIFEAQEIGAMQ